MATRTEEELLKALDATYRADPDHEDDEIERIQDVLRWVLGHDESTVEQFIKDYIAEDL